MEKAYVLQLNPQSVVTCCCDRGSLRKEVYFGSRFEGAHFIMKKSWQEELEVAGDLVITGREQSVMIAIDGCISLIFIFRRLLLKQCYPHFGQAHLI